MPVIHAAAAEARNAAAPQMSCGRPGRPSRIGATIAARFSGIARKSRLMSVSVVPGATALTVMPCGASSVAAVIIAMRCAAFEMQ